MEQSYKDIKIIVDKKYEKELYIDKSRLEPATSQRLNAVRHHENGKAIFEHFPSFVKGNVLDIGCSTGDILYLIHDNCIVDLPIFGIDIHANSLKLADEKKENRNIVFKLGDIINFETIDKEWIGFFDIITCFHTLEHLYEEDLKTAIINIRRLLKSGGHVIIGVPLEHAHDPGTHRTFFNINNLILYFNEGGFTVVDVFIDTHASIAGLFRI